MNGAFARRYGFIGGFVAIVTALGKEDIKPYVTQVAGPKASAVLVLLGIIGGVVLAMSSRAVTEPATPTKPAMGHPEGGSTDPNAPPSSLT